MIDIPPTSFPATPPTAGAAPNGSPATGDRRMISSDFETFLRMLTTQVENQDPLNPLDSTEFAVQLATFSSVEQQVKTNELLREITASGLARVAGWVGMDASTTEPVLFEGTAINLKTPKMAEADREDILVRASNGRVVDTFPAVSEGGVVQWSGRRADGTPFAPGLYSFEVVGYDGTGAETGRSEAEAFSRVAEVRLSADGPEVVFASGQSVPADEISSLRAP